MTQVTSNQPEGTPTWLDIGVPDIDRAKTFYGTLLGWEFQDLGAEGGGYNMCTLRGAPIAGMMRNPDDQPAEYWWSVYFATDDCDGTVKRVTDAGGEVVVAPMDVMDQGRLAIAKDPVGGQFGLWQGTAHAGSAIVNETGSFVWNDLFVPGDAGPARDFYEAVFGLRSERLPGVEGLDYTTLARPDGRLVGGVFGHEGLVLGGATEQVASWLTYFVVDDTDAAVERAVTGGGSVEEDPVDTPYGRIATVRDPFGVPFRLTKPAPSTDS
ncbi:hypothetical protein BZB76_4018 [Actinomadura pelletieri DSM 43383]|uniref:VOC domain-containing protein n=1 Tax=Actinomadura pelletieri DSM 43383 TaxID=1120940 RepID=A0A495QLG2_9ACTN|nr:VOC family protein [Actinomadura pelletieri]RKS73328.1 hypothetical protein BZB76_4018 [Actinomadura pelletieri DSM 43383]